MDIVNRLHIVHGADSHELYSKGEGLKFRIAECGL